VPNAKYVYRVAQSQECLGQLGVPNLLSTNMRRVKFCKDRYFHAAHRLLDQLLHFQRADAARPRTFGIASSKMPRIVSRLAGLGAYPIKDFSRVVVPHRLFLSAARAFAGLKAMRMFRPASATIISVIAWTWIAMPLQIFTVSIP
jgi:hypothetical protein